MENEERLALVAAGSVWFDEPEEEAPVFAPSGIVSSDAEEELYRKQRLADLLEDEEIYAQRDRARRLREAFAADPGTTRSLGATGSMAPGSAAPPAEGSVNAGVPIGMDPDGEAAGWQPDVNEMLSQQMNARFTVVEEPGAEAPGVGTATSAPAPDVEKPTTPTPPAVKAPATQ